MAIYKSILKANNFITLDEVTDWVNIKPEQYEIPPEGAVASLQVHDILYFAKEEGTTGNTYQIEYVGGAVAGSEAVSLSGQKIIVQIEDGISTADQIKDAVESHAVSSLVSLDTTAGQELVGQGIFPFENLSGGVVDVPFEDGVEKRRQLIERVLNSCCSKIESLIDSPVLVREFTEVLDANGSDTVIPSHYPIRQIVDIRYDTSRIFGDDTIIPDSAVLLRGVADKNYPSGDVQFQIIGSDIVISDVNGEITNVSGVGTEGIGAIKVTYRAGLGELDEIPYDIKLGAILLFEYLYKQRENGLLGKMSKTIKGDSAYKFTNGIPTEIHEMIESHIDYSFGTSGSMQRNG